jgi:hypothetical protein
MLDRVTFSIAVEKNRYLDRRTVPGSIRYRPDSGILTVDDHPLSRLTGASWPLLPLTIGSYDGEPLRQSIENVTGIGLPPVDEWGVRSGTWCVDLDGIGDPVSAVEGFRALRRKHDRRGGVAVTSGESATAYHGRAWSHEERHMGICSRTYVKGAELLAHGRPDLAAQCGDVVRFEVTATKLDALRSVWTDDRSDWIPTLAAMLDPTVQLYVLAREAQRMRLHEDATATSAPESLAARMSAVARWAHGRTRNSTDQTRRRADALVSTYAASSTMTAAEIVRMTGHQRTYVDSLLSELRAGGWAPDGTVDGSRDHCVRTIAAALDRQLPGWRARLVRPKLGPGQWMRSPYAAPKRKRALNRSLTTSLQWNEQ